MDAINSVQFCCHTGYPKFGGQVLGGEELWSLVDGLDANGLSDVSSHLLTGYVGSATLLVAYLFVANQILRKHPVIVDCMNLFGSACVGFNCFCKKAYAPMFLEVCWFGIAFAALVKHSI